MESITFLAKSDRDLTRNQESLLFALLSSVLFQTQRFLSLLPRTSGICHHYSKQWQITFNFVHVEQSEEYQVPLLHQRSFLHVIRSKLSLSKYLTMGSLLVEKMLQHRDAPILESCSLALLCR